MTNRTSCPVCIREVDIDDDGVIASHLDAAANRCPMSTHAASSQLSCEMTSASARRDELRQDLLWRLNMTPPSCWSDKLLETVANAIDLQFGEPQVEPPSPGRHLVLVPDLLGR